MAEINKYLWGTETCQTLYKHHINGGWEGRKMMTIGLSLLSLLLAELTSSLSARDFNLTSDHSVHTSHSRSLCGVRCETHVTNVTGEDNIWLEISIPDLFSQTSRQASVKEVGSEYFQLFLNLGFKSSLKEITVHDRYLTAVLP